jgi:hypothetical protein
MRAIETAKFENAPRLRASCGESLPGILLSVSPSPVKRSTGFNGETVTCADIIIARPVSFSSDESVNGFRRPASIAKNLGLAPINGDVT